MNQIKDGKHMYRCFEAHVTLYLTLHQKYLQSFIDSNIEIEKDLREAITSAIFNLKDYKTQEQDMLQRNKKNLLDCRTQNSTCCKKNSIGRWKIKHAIIATTWQHLKCYCFLSELHDNKVGSFI